MLNWVSGEPGAVPFAAFDPLAGPISWLAEESLMDRRRVLRLLVALPLVGCSSTGIVPMGQGDYMVAKETPFVIAVGKTKAALLREAHAFCEERNEELHVTNIEALDGRLFVRTAHAEIQFRCEAVAPE